MTRVAITTFKPSYHDAVASLIEQGILERKGDMIALTEDGAELVATECGWSRTTDGDGDECFAHCTAPAEFSYAETWLELVEQHRLAVVTAMMGAPN